MAGENIRQIIDKYRDRLTNSLDLQQPEASQYLVELSALMGNVNLELIGRQMAFNKKKLEYLDEIKSVAKADVKARTSDEYRLLEEVKGYKEVLLELTRALKYFLKALQDEQQTSKNL